MTKLSEMNAAQKQEFFNATGSAMTGQSDAQKIAAGVTAPDLVARTRLSRLPRPLTDFGVIAGGTIDQSAAINSAFDSGEEIYLPPLDFMIGDGLVLRNQTKATGSGPMRSRFVALPGATNPMITIAQGMVRYVTLRDFGIQGQTGNTGQNGIVVRGVVAQGASGGLWDSVFENIRCRGVDGTQLALLGATVLDNTIPAQFLQFSRLDFERPFATSKPVLYAHGQVEHLNFLGCRMHGPSSGAAYGGLNVYAGRAFGPSGDVIGSFGTGTALSAVAPRDWNFIGCSNENADQAMLFDAVENLTSKGGWFEQIKLNSILVQNSCRAIVSDADRFADAALDATNGVTIRANSAADITVRDPRFIGTNTVAGSTDGSGSILPVGSGWGGVATNNLLWDRGVANGTTQLDFGINPGALLSFAASGIQISRITSRLSPGELFTIKVKTTSPFAGALVANAGGGTSDISLGNATTLSLPPGSTTTIRRTQQVRGWDLIAQAA